MGRRTVGTTPPSLGQRLSTSRSSSRQVSLGRGRWDCSLSIVRPARRGSSSTNAGQRAGRLLQRSFLQPIGVSGDRHAPRPVREAPGAGASLRDVQDYAGHKDPRTTRRYDHARDSLDRNAAYAVAAYLA